MPRRHFPKRPGVPGPPRGIKILRKRKFQPTIETRSGIRVRSRYEKTCADYLFERGIEFQYEPLMLIGGRQFRPDFFLPELNLFLEICGYEHMPHYRTRIAQKKEIYDRNGLRALFVHYDGRGPLADCLKRELEQFCDRCNTDENP